MTQRTERDQRILELKQGLLARMAGLAMSTRNTGLEWVVKTLIKRQSGGPLAADPELEHPAQWDRPID